MTTNNTAGRRRRGLSVLSFIFMPEFHRSLEGGRNLYPLFVQMLASVFVAADLLPMNHPAAHQSARRNSKYSVSDLLGEAIYNLRRRRGVGVRAWGLFASIILMCVALFGSVAALGARVFLGLGDAAQAQIFSLPPCPALGACAAGTDMQTGNPGVPPNVGATLPMFDKRFGTAGGLKYDDWGLIMLDKTIREAAMNGPNPVGLGAGGQLQNAIYAIVLVFNTAISIIAAIMIFWIIVSIVVDTAAKGTFGGRHNMVWAPIRIVFALGMMLPLGSQGFSSGQYIIMKIAEWGSNLGSNGWTAYVGAVTGTHDMLAPVAPQGTAGLVNDIAQMKVCQVAFNDYVYQAANATTPATTPDPGQLVGAMNTWAGDGTHLIHTLTNNTANALCGSLNLAVPLGDAPGDAPPAGLAGIFTGNPFGSWGVGTPMGDVPPRPTTGASGNNFNMTVIEDTALDNAAASMAGTYLEGGVDSCSGGCINQIAAINANANGGGQTLAQLMAGARAQVAYQLLNQLFTVEADLATTTSMVNFACAFVSHHAPGGDTNGTDLAQYGQITRTNNTYNNSAAGGNQCNAGALNGVCGDQNTGAGASDDPDYSCHYASIGKFQTALAPMFGGPDGIGGTVMQAIDKWLSGNIQTDMARYGWASAGAYYSKVASVNVAVQAMSNAPITFTPGILTTVEATCDASMGNSTLCTPGGIAYRTATIMQAYSRWYDQNSGSGRGVAVAGSVGTNAVTGYAGQNAGDSFGGDKPGGNSTVSAKSLLTGGKQALEAAIQSAMGIPENRGQFMLNLVGSVSDNTLPMAHLTQIGKKMVDWGSALLVACALAQGLLGGINWIISTIAIMLSCLFSMIFYSAQIVISSGIILAFYLPLMPFIRSAFAVMTWMVSIYEAVIMVPVASLAFITTEGEGMGRATRGIWILWLNVLTRPILFVLGFIGAFIVYDAWIVYFTTAFALACQNSATEESIIGKIMGFCYYSVVYVTTSYAAANVVFKMVDALPAGLVRWLPGVAAYDTSFDFGAQQAGQYASQAANEFAGTINAGVQAMRSFRSRVEEREKTEAEKMEWYQAGLKQGRGGNQASVTQASAPSSSGPSQTPQQLSLNFGPDKQPENPNQLSLNFGGGGGAGGTGGAGGGAPGEMSAADQASFEKGMSQAMGAMGGNTGQMSLLGELGGGGGSGSGGGGAPMSAGDQATFQQGMKDALTALDPTNSANLNMDFIQRKYGNMPVSSLPQAALDMANPKDVASGNSVAIMYNYFKAKMNQ